MMEDRKAPSAGKKLVERLSQITALLIAVGALLAAIPPITQSLKDVYCGFWTCEVTQSKDATPPRVAGIRPDDPPNDKTSTDCSREQFWYNPGSGWRKVGKNQVIERGTIVSHFFRDNRVEEQGFRLDLERWNGVLANEGALKSETKLRPWTPERWPDGSLIRCPNWKGTLPGYRIDFLVDVPPGKYNLFGHLGSEFTTGFVTLIVE